MRVHGAGNMQIRLCCRQYAVQVMVLAHARRVLLGDGHNRARNLMQATDDGMVAGCAGRGA